MLNNRAEPGDTILRAGVRAPGLGSSGSVLRHRRKAQISAISARIRHYRFRTALSANTIKRCADSMLERDDISLTRFGIHKRGEM
jgi:hypothetical protein